MVGPGRTAPAALRSMRWPAPIVVDVAISAWVDVSGVAGTALLSEPRATICRARTSSLVRTQILHCESTELGPPHDGDDIVSAECLRAPRSSRPEPHAIVAELVDAVGGDTHRHTHTWEMVTPVAATIATPAIDNDDRNRGVRACTDGCAWLSP
jgi:hypothetical protein